jgi:PadR family transcriptional regulator AphA
MSLRHALLGALADRPRTGYELLKHFEQSLAYAWPASHSQIYPELARLREDGLIEQTGAGARNSKTYAVTEEGLAEVRRWLRETEPDRRVRSEAALRIFFLWLLEPDEARTELERERRYWSERLEELEAIKAGPRGPGRKEQAFGIALEGGIRSIETRLEWLSWAESQLGDRITP